MVATVYTRSLAIRYLPAILHEKWYPYTCFSHACEQLYGRVPCYALYARTVVDDGSKSSLKDKDQELYVSTVSIIPITLLMHFNKGVKLYITLNIAFELKTPKIAQTFQIELRNRFQELVEMDDGEGI